MCGKNLLFVVRWYFSVAAVSVITTAFFFCYGRTHSDFFSRAFQSLSTYQVQAILIGGALSRHRWASGFVVHKKT